MNENETLQLSFDGLPHAVAELHAKIDRLTGMMEKMMQADTAAPLPEIMTVEDVSAMLCKSVSTIYAMTSEHRIPYRKQGNKLYFMRTEIKSWLMDSVVPKDAPKRKRKPDAQEDNKDPDGTTTENRAEQPNENNATLALQASEIPAECDTKEEQQPPPCTFERRTHSRTGAAIFAVRFSDKVEAVGEKKFNLKAREFGGYWSDYGNGGYVFNTQEDAEGFANAIIGIKKNERTAEERLAVSYSPL